MWNLRIAAYCLMPNHYHMLLQTPDANISRSMRHLNGVYPHLYWASKNEARNAAIYLARKLRKDTLKQIGEQYGVDNDRTVRSVCIRMGKAMNEDKKTGREHEQIEAND